MTSYPNLIAKKLSGQISHEEARLLQEWLAASSENQRQFRQIEEAWQAASYQPSVRNQEQTFAKIAAQIGLTQKQAVPLARSCSRRRHYRWQVAASLILLIGATWLFVWHNDQRGQEPLREEVASALISKHNPRGQKSLITLPDGSRVKLNAESSLEYHADFAQTRRVTLTGEAFFDVVRDTLRPFVVSAGKVQVRVLGTSFNVQAFPSEENTMVAVASGAVLVQNGPEKSGPMSQLRAREMVRVSRQDGTFAESNFDPAEALAWKDGILTFQQASFKEIVHRLERWYGVDFVVRRRQPITEGFTGRYDNPSLEVVLEGMSFSSDFTFTINGKQVIID